MEKNSDILIAISSVLFGRNMGKDLINGTIEKEFGVKATWFLHEGDTASPRAQHLNNPDFFSVDVNTLSDADCYDYFCCVYEELYAENCFSYDAFLETHPGFQMDLKKLAAQYQDLYFTHPEINGERRRLLESIGTGRYLYAIWSDSDEGMAYKLERSGLRPFFKDCFVCEAFERDYGREVMARSYYEKTIRKTVDQYRARSYGPLVLISDYEGFYKRGGYSRIVYYDPNHSIYWELDSGYVAKNYDEIIKVVG